MQQTPTRRKKRCLQSICYDYKGLPYLYNFVHLRTNFPYPTYVSAAKSETFFGNCWEGASTTDRVWWGRRLGDNVLPTCLARDSIWERFIPCGKPTEIIIVYILRESAELECGDKKRSNCNKISLESRNVMKVDTDNHAVWSVLQLRKCIPILCNTKFIFNTRVNWNKAPIYGAGGKLRFVHVGFY